MTIIIYGLDRQGVRWFWNIHGAWQMKRNIDCHYATNQAAEKALRRAQTSERFKSYEDRMDLIEMETLT